ncbi:hypothetical protein J3E69DRAFT_336460 [Trichoderma sp. SZMC 28015]
MKCLFANTVPINDTFRPEHFLRPQHVTVSRFQMEPTRVLLRLRFVGDLGIDFERVVTAATEPLACMQLDWKIMTHMERPRG